GLVTIPTLSIGTAERYNVADEGYGPRAVPNIEGDLDLSEHLLVNLVDEGFDMTALQELDVDHGCTVINIQFLRSEEHTSELQSRFDLVCRLLLEKQTRRDGSAGL